MTALEYLGLQLAELQAFFGIEIPKDRLKVYLKELAHLTPEQVDTAAKWLRQTWRPSGPNPYPPICDILSACGQSPESGAMFDIAAITEMAHSAGAYRSVSFCDPALHHTINAFGGWPTICSWGQKEWDVNMGRMTEVYKEAKRRKADGGNRVYGIYEREGGNVWASVKYKSLRDPSVSGEIEYRGDLTDEAMATLDALCYAGDAPRIPVVPPNYGNKRVIAQVGAEGDACAMSVSGPSFRRAG
jgi:hypothetical protein